MMRDITIHEQHLLARGSVLADLTGSCALVSIGQRLQLEAECRATSMTRAIQDRLVPELVCRFHPQAIFLFGSVARGDPSPDSDADILVEMGSHIDIKARRSLARASLLVADLPFACDVIVLTGEEIRQKRLSGNVFFVQVDREKRGVYEQPRSAN